ncbi:MAG: hypothetical protein QOK05_1320 [Chloroflexota bacterium]|jgi:hypothetical protein|nr:hypothetical protein [Chloroflexota bacterium]
MMMTKQSTARRREGSANDRAARCTVPADAWHLVGPGVFDYVDAFAIGVPTSDRRPAEAWARLMFTPSGPIMAAFAVGWGAVTGTRPPRTGRRLGFFKVVSPGRRSTILEGDGPRYRIRLVVIAGAGRITMVTFVKGHGIAWRQALTPIMAAHRRVAPLLVERAAALGRGAPTRGIPA